MNTQDYTTTLVVDQSPTQVFEAINNVKGWWSQDFKGASEKEGDEFEVRFADMHYSRHKLTEVVPNQKIVWLVTDSNLSFLKNKTEWNGTSNIFEISEQDGKTHLKFTHLGLVPGIECFGDCTNGWNHFLLRSLLPYITTGQGKPQQVNSEVTLS